MINFDDYTNENKIIQSVHINQSGHIFQIIHIEYLL